MARKTEERREALRDRLIDIAEARIAEGGIHTIKARPLAEAADCSVGAIYNVFEDLNHLVMAVNGRTFKKLGDTVASAPDSGDPTERLVALGHAYLDFAVENPMLWRTLFDLEMSTDTQVPDWYLVELETLFAAIAAPLRVVFPQKPPEEISLMTRALFSSVHGIVLLGLEKRISAVPMDQLRHMIRVVLHNATSHEKI